MASTQSAQRAEGLKQALQYVSSLQHDAEPAFDALQARLQGLATAVEPLQLRVQVGTAGMQARTMCDVAFWAALSGRVRLHAHGGQDIDMQALSLARDNLQQARAEAGQILQHIDCPRC